MKKVLVGILVLAVVALGVWKLQSTKVEGSSDKQIIKVGILYPLSRDFGHIGEAGINAVKMFEKEINKNGRYKLILEDSQLNPAKAVTIAKKMIDFDDIDAMITIESNVGNAISPIMEQNKILHLSVSTDENVAKGKYNFTIATPPETEAEKLVDILISKDLRDVAIVMQNQAGIIATTNAIRKDSRINVVFDESINSGTKDFRILISKLIKTNPDIVVAQLFNPELPIFTKQLREAKGDMGITSVEVMGLPEDKTLFEGSWYIDAASSTSDFASKFLEQFSMSTNYSEFLYSGLELINYAFENNSDVDIAVDRLHNIKKLYTAIGLVSFNEKGVMQSEPSVRVISNGKVIIED